MLSVGESRTSELLHLACSNTSTKPHSGCFSAVRAICYLLEAEGPFWSGEAPCKRSALAANAVHSSVVRRDLLHARNFTAAQLLSHWYNFASSPFDGWFIALKLENRF